MMLFVWQLDETSHCSDTTGSTWFLDILCTWIWDSLHGLLCFSLEFIAKRWVSKSPVTSLCWHSVCGDGHSVISLCVLTAQILSWLHHVMLWFQTAEEHERESYTCWWNWRDSKSPGAQLWKEMTLNHFYALLYSLNSVAMSLTPSLLLWHLSTRRWAAGQLSVTMDACARIRGVPIRSRATVRKEVCPPSYSILFCFYLLCCVSFEMMCQAPPCSLCSWMPFSVGS